MGSRCVFHGELPHPRDESNVVPRAASPLCFGEGWGRGSSAQSQTPSPPPPPWGSQGWAEDGHLGMGGRMRGTWCCHAWLSRGPLSSEPWRVGCPKQRLM